MGNFFKIDAALSNKKEKEDFEINLKNGRGNVYNLLLFLTDVMFSYNAKQYFLVPKNHIILYPPNQLNCFKCAGGGYLNNSFVCFKTSSKNKLDVNFPIGKLIELSEEDSKSIDEKIDRISFLHNTNYEKESESEVDVNMYDILKIIEQAYELSDEDKNDNGLPARLNKLREEMYRAPQDFSVKKMADSLAYSLTWFGIIYKKQFGVSPVKDKEIAIVNKTKTILLKNDKTLDAIAEELNLASVSYLIRLFKRIEGISPYQFKLKSLYRGYKKRGKSTSKKSLRKNNSSKKI